MSFIYLHGFASGPRSRKAGFFREQLARKGIPLAIPDLAAGDFEHLTITRQLALLEDHVGDRPAVLIGSSLGGYLAALYAARHPAIQRAVLLAPAFGLAKLWEAELGPDTLARWHDQRTMPVFHHGESREVPLAYDFFEDALRWEPFPDVPQPALVFHGENDAVVPIAQSVAFIEAHPQDRLVRLSSGHELTDVLEIIWSHAADFLMCDNR